MILLRPVNLHWITDTDDPSDLCAHAGVEFTIGANSLISPDHGDWCVSAAALYLLRTLSRSHSKDSPVGEHLVPCCGHAMLKIEGESEVVVIGCCNGIDWRVVHERPNVVLQFDDGSEFTMAFDDWRTAVCDFSDAVSRFYDSSKPKEPHDEFSGGFALFIEEWMRRRLAATDP